MYGWFHSKATDGRCVLNLLCHWIMFHFISFRFVSFIVFINGELIFVERWPSMWTAGEVETKMLTKIFLIRTIQRNERGIFFRYIIAIVIWKHLNSFLSQRVYLVFAFILFSLFRFIYFLHQTFSGSLQVVHFLSFKG